MDRVKLLEMITEADIPGLVRQDLTRRLKVASCEGCASVVRDFEAAVIKRRKDVLQSHRRFFEGRGPAPHDKRMPLTAFKVA